MSEPSKPSIWGTPLIVCALLVGASPIVGLAATGHSTTSSISGSDALSINGSDALSINGSDALSINGSD
ncbi:MAG: hypothetical protein P8X75_15060, partial [Limibacillus sp.]